MGNGENDYFKGLVCCRILTLITALCALVIIGVNGVDFDKNVHVIAFCVMTSACFCLCLSLTLAVCKFNGIDYELSE